MTSTEGFQAMDIIRLTQNGQNLYTQGKLVEALQEFEKAHRYAVRFNHRPTIETCAYNLACAYAANKNGEQTSKYLKALSHSFTDTLNKAELTFLTALAEQHKSENSKKETITLYKSALDQLNLLESNMHASQKKHILQELCVLERDTPRLAEYKFQLAGIYGYLKMPYLQVQLLCERAELLFKSHRESEAVQAATDCLLAVQELKGKNTVSENSQRENEDNSTPKEEILSHEKLIVSLNELGLLFTQLQEYDKAVECFQQGLDIISGEDQVSRHEAVLLQNIGAVYNFRLAQDGNFVQKALQYHQKAIDHYEDNNNSRGLAYCYLNKAYAEYHNLDRTSAQEAYLVALHKAREKTGKKGDKKNDIRTQWQALEGLGSVACCHHDTRKAQEYFHKALKLVHQDEQDMVQHSACDRILEKLLSVSTRPSSREMGSTGPGLGTMLSRLGSTRPLDQGSTAGPPSDSKQLGSSQSWKKKRHLKVRKTGSLRQFDKVARGLLMESTDLTQRDEEESESGSSSESETSTVSDPSEESDESAPTTSASTVATQRPADNKKPVPSQTYNSNSFMSKTQRPMSSRISRRQSAKGLKKSLLMSSDEDEGDQRRIRDAYRQLQEESESEEESSARTPRTTGQHLDSSSEQSDSDQTIEEKTDDDEDDEHTENSNSRQANQSQRSSVKRGGSELSGTKSLRFQTPGSSSDDSQGRHQRSEVSVDVHGNGKFNGRDSRAKSRQAQQPDSESESEDSDELSDEDTHDERQAPPLPTQSPPATMHRTYEKPVMMNNPVYGSASRESTGHYADIELERADSGKQQGGESSPSFGESTMYETIRPAVPDRGHRGGRTRREEDEEGDEISTEEEEDDGNPVLSRGEREQKMMLYHQKHGQKQEATQQDTKEGKSKTCVIS